MIKDIFKCVGYYVAFTMALGWWNTQSLEQYGFLIKEYPESGGEYRYYLAKIAYDPNGAIYINGEEKHIKKRGDTFTQYRARAEGLILKNHGSGGIDYSFDQYEPFRYKEGFSSYTWKSAPFMIPFYFFVEWRTDKK